MAETNSDTTTVVDDDTPVTEEDLRDLKYPKEDVETSEEEDEPTDGEEEAAEESDETVETEEESDGEEEKSEEATFVKEFPNIKGDTPEEYAKNLEIAYQNSFVELKRLRDEGTNKEPETTEAEDVDTTADPSLLYVKQKMDEEITEAFSDFSKRFPQVADADEYTKFTNEVAVLSQTIYQSQKRLASPRELYNKAAVILGWESDERVSDEDRLGNALKNTAAITKTPAAPKKTTKKSKVTDAMIAANRLMYPDKTDAEIRAELEPYVP